MEGVPLLLWLGDHLEKADTGMLDLLRCMGSAAGRTRFLDRLGELLKHGEATVRFCAISAVEAIGSAGMRQRILAPLVALLDFPDPDLRNRAAMAFRALGQAAGNKVIDRLRDLLEHPRSEWPFGPARRGNSQTGRLRRGRPGGKAARLDLLCPLVECLQNPNHELRPIHMGSDMEPGWGGRTP